MCVSHFLYSLPLLCYKMYLLTIQPSHPSLFLSSLSPSLRYPWGEEAFEKARSENKPIFLSVGYSTCHWCHVMERESFENPEIGKILSEHFVSIKVEEERVGG